MTALCKRCLTGSIEIFTHLTSTDLEAWRKSAVLDHVGSVLTALSRIQILTEELKPHIKDINEGDLASALEKEMQHTVELIARAEAKFKV